MDRIPKPPYKIDVCAQHLPLPQHDFSAISEIPSLVPRNHGVLALSKFIRDACDSQQDDSPIRAAALEDFRELEKLSRKVDFTDRTLSAADSNKYIAIFFLAVDKFFFLGLLSSVGIKAVYDETSANEEGYTANTIAWSISVPAITIFKQDWTASLLEKFGIVVHEMIHALLLYWTDEHCPCHLVDLGRCGHGYTFQVLSFFLRLNFESHGALRWFPKLDIGRGGAMFAYYDTMGWDPTDKSVPSTNFIEGFLLQRKHIIENQVWMEGKRKRHASRERRQIANEEQDTFNQLMASVEESSSDEGDARTFIARNSHYWQGNQSQVSIPLDQYSWDGIQDDASNIPGATDFWTKLFAPCCTGKNKNVLQIPLEHLDISHTDPGKSRRRGRV